MCCFTNEELNAHPELAEFQTAEAPRLVQPTGSFTWDQLHQKGGCVACESAKVMLETVQSMSKKGP